jgi:hypothetical protein
MNHTSSDCEWFQEARSSPDNPKRDWYVWTDDPTLYSGARIIFVDTETSNWTWDEKAGAYYWHRFFHHQPDLNYDNPEVREAMLDVLRFWLDAGLDGFRLDAVPYLYERDGTNCENLDETHVFLKEVRATVDREYPDRVLLAEANQWPADVVHRPVVGMHAVEVGDVVAAVAQRRGVHRQQPDDVDAEPLQVVELLRQPAEVAVAVAGAVVEPAQVDLVEDRGLEPQRVRLEPLAGSVHGVVLVLTRSRCATR